VSVSQGLIKKKSDYDGDFIYENDTLRFIQHEEGRVIIHPEEVAEGPDLVFTSDCSSVTGFGACPSLPPRPPKLLRRREGRRVRLFFDVHTIWKPLKMN
jgi:hypothetical protein